MILARSTWDLAFMAVVSSIARYNLSPLLFLLHPALIGSNGILWPKSGFTMSDPSCLQAGCPFSGGGNPGPCTATSGILSDPEIQAVIDAGATVTLDQEAAVMIVTWDTNQWVSYDNAETFKMKIDYANSRCLGG